MNAWSVSCSLAQRPTAAAMTSGPLSARSAWGAPCAKTARSSISITSTAPMCRSTRKARCWRVNSSMTLQTLKTRPFQSESNWKSMAHTCPGARAVTRGCRCGACGLCAGARAVLRCATSAGTYHALRQCPRSWPVPRHVYSPTVDAWRHNRSSTGAQTHDHAASLPRPPRGCGNTLIGTVQQRAHARR